MPWRRAIPWLVAALAFDGCTTLPKGQDATAVATIHPGWQRVRAAAADAARDPWVWAPLLGAAAFQVEHMDRKLSGWARGHTPVFGTTQDAVRWSNDLRSASAIACGLTIFLAPGGDSPSEWVRARGQVLMVDLAAVGATSLMTLGLKDAADRERPNAASNTSFPSGHSSASAAYTRLAMENLESMPLGRTSRRWLDGGLAALTAGTAWARVEAGAHFPSDVLAGVALGNFLADFFNGAFLGHGDADAPVAFSVTPDGAMLEWRRAF